MCGTAAAAVLAAAAALVCTGNATAARGPYVLDGGSPAEPAAVIPHGQLAEERFASTIAWAYWPSAANVLRPHCRSDEAGGVAPARFRTLLASVLAAAAQ